MDSQDSYALYRQRLSEIDLLRERSEWLSDKDRALMLMVLEKGSTFGQLARLTGESPSTVSRRFHRLLAKLINRQLLPLLRGREEFDNRDLRIIQDYYLKGKIQKALARKFNISLYRIRAILRTARAIVADYSHSGPPAVTHKKQIRPFSPPPGAAECIH